MGEQLVLDGLGSPDPADAGGSSRRRGDRRKRIRGSWAGRLPVVGLIAVAFLAGGLFVPKVVEAASSSGERAIFEPLAPARILDTRFGPSPLAVGTKVGPGQTIEIQVLGQGGVLNDATAVALNVTATGATAESHLTVFPGATAVAPTASNLNFGVNDTIPNAVVVKIGTNGKVAIRNNSGSVHVITDVNGFYRDHNHDDRYDTKAQVDTKVANGIATPNHVASNQIADGTVGNADLAANAVNSAKIADGTVGNADLADSSVNSAKIADGSVGNADLAPNAVTGAKVADGSLTTVDLQKGSASFSPDLSSISVPGHGCENIALVASGLVAGDLVATTVTSGQFSSSSLFIPVTTANPAGTLITAVISVCSDSGVAIPLPASISFTARVLAA